MVSAGFFDMAVRSKSSELMRSCSWRTHALAEHLGLDEQNFRNRGWSDFQLTSHQCCVYFSGDSDQFAVNRKQRAAKALGQRHKQHVIRRVLVLDGQ